MQLELKKSILDSLWSRAHRAPPRHTFFKSPESEEELYSDSLLERSEYCQRVAMKVRVNQMDKVLHPYVIITKFTYISLQQWPL